MNGHPANGKALGVRLKRRRTLMDRRRYIVNFICGMALVGIVLMMLETELFIHTLEEENVSVAFVIKILISISTVLLLVGICANYYTEMCIRALDEGVKDWLSVATNSTWCWLFMELVVCSVHPFPGDMSVQYTSPAGDSTKVSVDAILSILMMARLYLISYFAVVHSRLLTDASTNSIGALSKIKINTLFVFKAVMTTHPGKLLVSIMVTTFIVNSWAMRTCEIYYDKMSNSYMEVMWLIATTFLTVGYGDMIPRSYCGRYISVCTGIIGVGTTALLVAVVARKLEQTRPEKYVFNMVSRIQIEKRRKTAAANVIKSIIRLWMIKKYAAGDVDLRIKRKFEDNLKTATRKLRTAKVEMAHIGDFNVGILEVSETVNRINDTVEGLAGRLEAGEYKTSMFENRLSNIEGKLDEIRTMLSVRK